MTEKCATIWIKHLSIQDYFAYIEDIIPLHLNKFT